MPDWSIHLAIAKRINDKLNLGKDLFYYGNLLPDIDKSTLISRDETHYGNHTIPEVIEREYNSLINILNNYHDKKILIVGHSTSLASLFSKWCEIGYTDSYKFNGKQFFDGKCGYCETF